MRVPSLRKREGGNEDDRSGTITERAFNKIPLLNFYTFIH